MTEQESFTCPRCGRTSYHPEDIRWGYCGNCHDYTRAERTERSILFDTSLPWLRQPEHDHVLSCPGCWSWQLHYTDQVATEWPDGLKAFEDMVEAILREHVGKECSAPQLVHFLAKQRGLIR